MTRYIATYSDARRVFAAQIAAAYVSNNHVTTGELPALIASIHTALNDAANGALLAPNEQLTPGQIRRSVTPEALISFIDGKPYKTLKRHLTAHGLTPDLYRQQYGLPDDYPLVSSNYSERRSQLAHNIGLGNRKGAAKTAGTTDTVTAAPQKHGRKKAD